MFDTVPAATFAASYGEAEVLVSKRTAKVNNVQTALSKFESAFLYAIAQAEGQVMTPRMLLRVLWPIEKQPDQGILNVYAWRVRRKLERAYCKARRCEKAPSAELVLSSQWNRGFAFGKAARAPAERHVSLPAHDVKWNDARKTVVVSAIRLNLVTKQEVLGFYPCLSAAELAEWSDVQYLRSETARNTNSSQDSRLVA